MTNRVLYFLISIIFGLIALAWYMPGDDRGLPIVCSQISPDIKYEKQCTSNTLDRVRESYRWVAVNVYPVLSPTAMAGVASFIEDTGRCKNSEFFRRLSRNDIEGACDKMLSYVHHRGEVDYTRVKRREKERAMCLSKG